PAPNTERPSLDGDHQGTAGKIGDLERRRNSGRVGTRVDVHRLDASGYHRDPANPTRLGGARSRNGGYLMADGISLNVAALGALAPDGKSADQAKLKDAAGKFE